MKYICSSLMGVLVALLWSASPALSATLLPPGKSCFYDAAGAPLAAGTVAFYVPQTLSPKDTWQDAGQTILNTNPVALDASGCAIIYGNGSYRQILKDFNGVTIWDQPTSTSISISASWGGVSGGSANAQTVDLDAFDLTDGQVVNFLAGFSNTTAMTLNVNGTGPVAVVRDSGAGPIALTGGEIVAGNVVSVLYVSSTGQFHLITPTPIQVLDSAVYFTGVLTPTILASSQDNWTPAGNYPAANTLRISSNIAVTITGLTGGAAGRTLFIHNVGSFAVTLSPNDAASTAANQFSFSSPVVLGPNDSISIQYDAISSRWRNISPATATFPPGAIYGCTMSNNAADAANDIDITACLTAATNASVDQRGIAMTKRLDAVWAAGTNQGMRSSSALADGTWHIFAISKPDGIADYFAHTALDPSSVLPSGYTNYRRIGSIIRASSTILGFVQIGDEFLLKSPPLSISAFAQSATSTLHALTTPSGLQLKAKANVSIVATGAGGGLERELYISSPLVDDLNPSPTAAPLSSMGNRVEISSGNVVGLGIAKSVSEFTNTSSQWRVDATAAVTLYVATVGWTDTRGKDF